MKIRRAKTDAEPLPDHMAGLENRPEARNLVGILAAHQRHAAGERAARTRRAGLRGVQGARWRMRWWRTSQPIAAEMKRLLDDPGALDAALHIGAERARAIAEPIAARAREIVGFLPAKVRSGERTPPIPLLFLEPGPVSAKVPKNGGGSGEVSSPVFLVQRPVWMRSTSCFTLGTKPFE